MWDSVSKQKSKLARVKQFYIHVTFACVFLYKNMHFRYQLDGIHA